MRQSEGRNRVSAAAVALAAVTWWIAPAGASAVAATGEEAAPAEPSWRGSDGPFHAELVLTRDSEKLFESWNRDSPPEQKPPVPEVSALRRGSMIDLAVLFGGCQPELTGLCDCEVDFRVLAPDGSVYARHPAAELWKRRKAPAAGVWKVGVASLELEIEPGDPLGLYRLEATVRDMVSEREVRLSRQLEVVEGP